MATKIQGITIEVGGDTSPLAKAFESANKVISRTQTELRQVEKSLKLDPGNAELLAQKQELLSKQIENTSNKISKLKEIEREVQKRREADPTNDNLAQQLRAVQRELSNTEAGLSKLQAEYNASESSISELNLALGESTKKHLLLKSELDEVNNSIKLNADNAGLLGQKQELLSRQIDNTAGKVDLLTKKEQEIQKQREADPSNEELASELRKVQRELSDTKSGLQKLQTEYKDTEDTLKNLNQTVDDSAGKHRTFKDRLAGVFQGLKDFVTGNHEAADAAGTSATELNSKLEIWDKFSGVVANAAQKLFDFVSGAAQKADDLNTLAKVTGLTTEEIQKLQYSSSFVDVEFDTLSSSLSHLTKGMSDAQRGTGEAKQGFDELRVKLIDNHGQMRNNTEVFYEIIDKLGKIENVTKRDSIAMAIFGESAQNLNPLIEAGSEQLRALGIEAENAGIIMSQETLDGANEFNDAMDRLKLTLAGAASAAGAELAGSMVALIEAIMPLISMVAEFIGLIAGLPPEVLAVIAVFIAVIAIVIKVSMAVSIFSGALGVANLSMIKTVGIILAVVAAVAALLALIVVLAGKKDDIADVGESIKDMVSEAGNVNVSGTEIPRRATGTNYINVNEIPRNATGTNYHPGGLAFITEYSPEQLSLPNGTNMVVMPRGTKVTPNVSGVSNTGAGGGDVFNISINANNVKEFNDIIRLAERARQERRAM